MNVRKPVDYSAMFAALNTLMAADLPQMELYCEIGRLVSGRGHAAHIVGAKSALFRFRLRRKLHSAPLPLLSPRDPLCWARAGAP